MEFAQLRLRMKDDRLILTPLKVMRSFPAIQDEFMLRHIVEATNDSFVLNPDDELSHFHTCFYTSVTQSEYHFVAVEDVDAVLLSQLCQGGCKPTFGELHVRIV